MIDQQRQVVGRALDRRRVVVLRDRAADDDACTPVEQQQQRIEDLAADVVEIDVDALRAVLREAGLHVFRLVVDGGVEAELVDDVLHFSGPPAMPTTRQPLILAIWPATAPTAPAAPEMTTVSPALG